MKSIIISMPGCSRCKMLKELCPDAEVIQPSQEDLIKLGRMLNIQSLPFVVLSGEITDLEHAIKGD